MKKTVVFVLISVALLCASTLFAQTSAQMIIVQSVVGKVEYEVSAGTWAAVTPQMKLAPSTMINTGLNSTLVVKYGDKVVTIKAMQKGTIEKLIQASVAGTGGGITIGASAASGTAATASTSDRSNISTASTRASEATEDVEWVDEEGE